MMYDELVKDLHYLAKVYSICENENTKEYDLAVKAADAIEELMRRCEQFQYMPLPAWIPVTEALPEDGEFVLVCNDDGHMMIAKHETETYEWYYKYTNYDIDIWDNEEQGPVCHWMPLPEPPKEE